MTDQPVLVWFRNDLRLTDHAALRAAAKLGPVLPVFVLDEAAPGQWRHGSASRWWLHHSLASLAADLEKRDGALILRHGDSADELSDLVRETNAQALYFSRAYEPWARELEQTVRDELESRCDIKRFASALLFEPDRVATKNGDPYRVFTPFWNTVKGTADDTVPKAVPRNVSWYEGVSSESLDDWRLLPTQPDWAGGLRKFWRPGEAGAKKLLRRFVDSAADDYPVQRDRPDLPKTSRLSPHLHFGEISPRQIWHRLRTAAAHGDVDESAAWAYLRELGWREFSHHLLFHFPTLPEANFRPQFERFPWRDDKIGLTAWQRGRTGFPIVDAGMRELWHTGWMHNRVRMIVGSFLIKDLLVHWRAGEDWFWDTLVDADLANNAASWQWVAGSGADASPYFRVFNPITQGEKFDPNGAYVRKWVPELAELPNKYLQQPWNAPADVLKQASIKLGEDYPEPIVDHADARRRALAAFGETKG